jgi:hypothetical protein
MLVAAGDEQARAVAMVATLTIAAELVPGWVGMKP